MCSNVDKGCKWEGTVGTLEEHVAANCKFALCPCPNQCIDGHDNVRVFMRVELHRHLKRYCPKRKQKCKMCGEEGTYNVMANVHAEVCKKKIVACPNAECTMTVLRESIKRHLEDCLHTEVPCKYQRLGCDVRMKRKDVLEHESKDEFHLRLALDKVVAMELYMENMARSVNATYLKNGEAVTFRLGEIQLKKDTKEDFYSPTFYTSCRGYCMCIKLYTNSAASECTHVLVCPGVVKGKYDNELQWPFVGTVTCEILNQLEDNHHLKKRITFQSVNNVVAGTFRGGYRSFFFEAHDAVKNAQYLKGDALYFRVSVDIPDYKPWLECATK